MKNLLLFVVTLLLLAACNPEIKTIYLHEMDLASMETGWGTNQVNKSVDGNPLTIAGQVFEKGVGTHAISKFMMELKGNGKQFSAKVGVDDESGENASIEFFVMGDGKILWQSGILKKGDPAKPVDVKLKSIQKLALYVSDGGDNLNYDHANWAEGFISFTGEAPAPVIAAKQQTYILTPSTSPEPRINYPRIFAAGAGKPFLFRIPATGEQPLKISAKGLPEGLKLDENTGIISGETATAGTYKIEITATNPKGKDVKELEIVIGGRLALTPPMGWNSWNCWGLSVDQQKVKAAAEAFVESGLANHGWAYINIDDGWEAAERTKNGELLANEKFPDMKALADDVHHLGLKLGIYSSPGPKTCGGYLGSWEHEMQDAQTWAGWGIDYLKYDWCSYGEIAADNSLAEYQKPYLKMRKCLDAVNRDIIYSLCQYGMGDVWEWGGEVGGNLWRTTGDINDSWASMSGIGFAQEQSSPFARPGNWNDPDMLVVGKVGWGPDLRETNLTPDEQYTHISLWSLLSAPLLIGCDLTQLDDFTMNLLTNDEVIGVNQDPLGKQAVKILDEKNKQVWMKKLSDGSIALGLFFTGSNIPEEAFSWDGKPQSAKVGITWNELGLQGRQSVRDLWRQKELGIFDTGFETDVPYHGVVLVKVSETK
jgi:alpha-galactosidase